MQCATKSSPHQRCIASDMHPTKYAPQMQRTKITIDQICTKYASHQRYNAPNIMKVFVAPKSIFCAFFKVFISIMCGHPKDTFFELPTLNILSFGGTYPGSKSETNVVRFLQFLAQSDRLIDIYLQTKLWPRNASQMGQKSQIGGTNPRLKNCNLLSSTFEVERPFQRYQFLIWDPLGGSQRVPESPMGPQRFWGGPIQTQNRKQMHLVFFNF